MSGRDRVIQATSANAEWAVIEAQLSQRNRLGWRPKAEMCSVINALLYLARTGCQWAVAAREFSPTTVKHYFMVGATVA
jgi:transposase